MAKGIKGCTKHHRYRYFQGIRKQQRGFLHPALFLGPEVQHVGSQFPNQGSNPALGVWSLNHWMAREVPTFCS